MLDYTNYIKKILLIWLLLTVMFHHLFWISHAFGPVDPRLDRRSQSVNRIQ